MDQSAGKAMLQIEALRSGWERHSTSAGLSCALSWGDHLQLQGGSGSGKTCLLRVIAGLQRAQQGGVYWQSTSVTEAQLARWRQQIVYCPQQAIVGADTVADALLLPWHLNAEASALPSDDKLVEALTLMDLSLALNASTSRLSGGEQYRLMLARSCLLDRPIWLLDEPTAALDNYSSQRVADVLTAAPRIVISISHDPFWQQLATQRYDLAQDTVTVGRSAQ
uniref:ABC transporter ATP-binding protein n=1 Tax=Thaumasiovibrio occultus TaxID=1891184 RepID=UPI000B35E1FF|nr:ATP-binding cassette domain-containing protein [Thaumasiovibrio occultus]